MIKELSIVLCDFWSALVVFSHGNDNKSLVIDLRNKVAEIDPPLIEPIDKCIFDAENGRVFDEPKEDYYVLAAEKFIRGHKNG